MESQESPDKSSRKQESQARYRVYSVDSDRNKSLLPMFLSEEDALKFIKKNTLTGIANPHTDSYLMYEIVTVSHKDAEDQSV
jgi:hypothetical protein